MAEPRNPFRHHHGDHDHDHDHDHHGHDHGHAHSHEHEVREELDPAQQALSDALRVCFGVLKIVMVVLLIAYCFSGLFSVKEKSVALRLRFGKIVGEGESRIIKPGGLHWALPYPIEESVSIDMTTQQIRLANEFWWDRGAMAAAKSEDEEGGAKMGPLNPERDGSLLTGDANIIHAICSVKFNIEDPVAYFTNVGSMAVANDLVTKAAEQAVIYTTAHQTADAIMKGQFDKTGARLHAQRILDAQGTGLKIADEGLVFEKPRMPGSVREAYNAVLNAENERATVIEKAQQERTKLLVEVAGDAHDALWKRIVDYQRDTLNAPRETVDAKDLELDKVFRELKVDGKTITGKVSQIINDSMNYRSTIVSDLRGEASRFDSLYARYSAAPALRTVLMVNEWQKAREQIMTGDVETIYLPSGQTYIELNPDPAVKKKREADRLAAEQKAREERAKTVGNAGGPPPPP